MSSRPPRRRRFRPLRVFGLFILIAMAWPLVAVFLIAAGIVVIGNIGLALVAASVLCVTFTVALVAVRSLRRTSELLSTKAS